MIEFIWLAILIAFLATGAVLFMWMGLSPVSKEMIDTLLNGFWDGLKGSGFAFRKRKYPVELYRLILTEEGDICDDCLEHLSSPPMDIADWMKEGYPKNPLPGSPCGKKCLCELMITKRTYLNQP